MSNKTIAARLREFANGDSDSINDFCSQIADTCGFDDDGLRKTARHIAEKIEQEHNALIEAQDASAHHTMLAYAEDKGMPMEENETITQWLDRWFVPRPRFEDNQPVSFGDEVDGIEGTIKAVTVYADGFGKLETQHDYRVFGRDIAPLKHPAKVYDAEGVELKAGDICWLLGPLADGECVGDEVTIINPSVRDDEFGGICVKFKNNRIGTIQFIEDPKKFTHKEPDSLEKLRDDMIDLCGTDGEDSSLICDELADCAARLTALMERDRSENS